MLKTSDRGNNELSKLGAKICKEECENGFEEVKEEADCEVCKTKVNRLRPVQQLPLLKIAHTTPFSVVGLPRHATEYGFVLPDHLFNEH